MPPSTKAAPASKADRFLEPALRVAAVALAASFMGLFSAFAMDDVAIIAGDERLHSLGSFHRFFAEPYWPVPYNPDLYRPLTSLLLSLQWQLGGGSPFLFHLVSTLLYVAVSLAVLRLARRLLPEGPALAAGVLFAAHPAHVEVVAQGVNQAEQCVALLAVLATTLYLEARRRGGPTVTEWTLLGAMYAAACLLKENAVILPGLLLAAEATVVPGSLRVKARKVAVPFVAISAIGVLFLLLRASVLGSFAGSMTAESLLGQNALGRALTMLQVVPEWLRLVLWPAHLQGDYTPAVIARATGWGVLQTAGVVILALVALLAWITRTKNPPASFGLMWSAVALLPVSNVIVPTGVVLAERTLYLTSVGAVIAVVAIVSRIERGAAARARALTGATAVLALAGVARSAVRHTDWRDNLHFWERTVQDAPTASRAHRVLAGLLFDGGDVPRAEREYALAAALNPSAYWVLNELGDVYRRQGECSAALPLYKESLQIEANQPQIRLLRISCLVQLGRFEEARREGDEAIRVQNSSGSPPP